MRDILSEEEDSVSLRNEGMVDELLFLDFLLRVSVFTSVASGNRTMGDGDSTGVLEAGLSRCADFGDPGVSMWNTL